MAREKSYSPKGEDGRQTMVLIAILLALIVIVGAALVSILTRNGGGPVEPVLPNGTTGTQNPPGQNNTIETPIVPPCEGQCLFDMAVSGQNVSACRAISESNLSQSCFEQLSGSSLEACMEVADADKLQVCITSFAVAQRNITLCSVLVQGLEECILSVDPCFNATDKALCKAIHAGDASLCVGGEQCLLNYSMEKKDVNACSLISDNVVSTACKSAVLYSDRCSSLPADATQDYCYSLFAIYSGDHLTCTQIRGNSIYLLECLSYFSVKLGNYSICNSEKLGLNERWGCYTNYSLASGDLAGCRNIDKLATTNQFRCSFEYAKKYGDPSACEIIGSLGSKSTCYEGAIIYSNANLDYTKCAGVKDFTWQNKCYTESAKLNGDVSLCNRITAEYARESCRGAYEANRTSSK